MTVQRNGSLAVTEIYKTINIPKGSNIITQTVFICEMYTPF